jgi:cbb3-type cytochrome oxidase subunit 3
MKEAFASGTYGLAGLIIFFVFFMGVLVWLYRPGMKQKYQKFGQIPLEDEKK